MMKKIMFVFGFFLISACSEREGLETGEKLYSHYCISCHTNDGANFIKNINTGVLTRRASLTVAKTILDDSAHGSKKVKKLNELSQKESQMIVKYLYQLKIEFETDGRIKNL